MNNNQNSSNVLLWAVVGILAVLAIVVYSMYKSNDTQAVTSTEDNKMMNGDNMAMGSTSGMMASNTSDKMGMEKQPPTYVKDTSGYPSSWPTDIAKYPGGVVISSANDNLKSRPKEAIAIVTTKDSVRTVVNFYLNNLVKNGWTITEDGAGLANQITFRSSKNGRTFSGYAERMQTGGTKITMGVNEGM